MSRNSVAGEIESCFGKQHSSSLSTASQFLHRGSMAGKSPREVIYVPFPAPSEGPTWGCGVEMYLFLGEGKGILRSYVNQRWMQLLLNPCRLSRPAGAGIYRTWRRRFCVFFPRRLTVSCSVTGSLVICVDVKTLTEKFTFLWTKTAYEVPVGPWGLGKPPLPGDVSLRLQTSSCSFWPSRLVPASPSQRKWSGFTHLY